ncbi:DUF3800 domain-containing protein [Actinoplanes sp. NPDC051861]|uniref:DUF3800 domain-containing protein n=1 Tax=Actinoplanes sp. NPDC051861 TaxID=3155170 RepID=UPI003415FDB7
MLLAYVDESYTRDWFCMAALLCDDAFVQPFTQALDDLIVQAGHDFGVPADAELHGYELFHGEGSWKDVPPRYRIGVDNRAFAEIAANGDALICRGMNLVRRSSPETPHSTVLRELLERVNDYAATKDARVLVIADEVGQEQALHRADFVAQRLSHILDTLQFTPSRSSRMLQAIDLVAFMYRRIERHKERDSRAQRANEALWMRIAPLIVHLHRDP